MSLKETNRVKTIGVLPTQNAEPIPVGKIPDDGTQVAKWGTATNGISVMHTVTADKTLYLTSFWVSMLNETAANDFSYGAVRNTGDTFQYYLGFIPVAPACSGFLSLTFPVPLEIPAGYDVYLYAHAAGLTIYASMYGYEM